MPAVRSIHSKAASWLQAFKSYLHPAALRMGVLGFAAGLPLLLVFSTLTAWLRDFGVSRSAIGLFAWVYMAYSVKVFWAPIVDNLRLPILSSWLGRRRGWMLIGQIGVIVGLLSLSVLSPQHHLWPVALAGLLVAFSSATQDIAIDAYRIEIADPEMQGTLSATYVFGYRFAMLLAGAGALLIADVASWGAAYASMALLMGVGVLTVLLIPEPVASAAEAEHVLANAHVKHHSVAADTVRPSYGQRLNAWLYRSVMMPFQEFFQRNGWWALFILSLIGLFRLSDITMGIMANPFYIDLGFTKTQIAAVSKVYGFAMTLIGAFVGGVVIVKYGLYRPLFVAAIAAAATNLLFAQMAHVGASVEWLTIVISADNLSGGLGNATLIAYLASLTNRAYTATQYALFSSLMTLPGKMLSSLAGFVVDAWGYLDFFYYAAALGIPAIVLSFVLVWQDGRSRDPSSNSHLSESNGKSMTRGC